MPDREPIITVTPTEDVLADVHAERGAQEDLWGQQSHPDGTSETIRTAAAYARIMCERNAEAGVLTWKDILHEEVCEAFAETDPGALRKELVQVAAVAVAWVEHLDRRAVEEAGAWD